MLFDQAEELYTYVEGAIDALGDAWNGGQLDLSVLDREWKRKLEGSCSSWLLDSLLLRDELGKVTGYNYELVYRILKKNPSGITELEYAAVAYVFALEEDIERKEGIINACYDLLKDGVKQHTAGGLNTTVVISERSAKLNKILEKVAALEAGIYAGVNSLKTEEERKAVCASGILGKIQQSKVLLEQILNSSKYLAAVSRTSIWNDQQNVLTDNPIVLEMDDNGVIQLQYVECDPKAPCLSYDSYHPHTITVSSSLMGDTMRDLSDKDDLKWFAETNGIPTNKGETHTQLATDWATFLVQEGIDRVPVLGDIVSLPSSILDQISSSSDTLRGGSSYEQMSTVAEIKQMADNYKLRTIRVTHKYKGKDSLFYSVFEGIGDSKNTESTRKHIYNLNKNLSPGGDYEEYAKELDYNPANPITVEDVMKNPKKVIQLQEKWLIVCGDKKK